MTEPIANVVQSDDSFGVWLSRTNQVIEALRNKVLSTSAALVGNVSMTGTFISTDIRANTISANVVTIANNVAWHAGNDGAGSGLDADLLDGQSGTYYTDIPARLGYTPLNSANYTASSVLTLLLTVDGATSTLDADLLDGQQGSFYQNASNLNAGTVPAARLAGNVSFTTVTSTTDTANTVNANTINANNIVSGNVAATNLSGNGAGVTSVNASTLGGQSSSYYANATHTHDFSLLTGIGQVVQYNVPGQFTRSQRISYTALVDGATITPDFSLTNGFTATLGGNRTLANPTNLASAAGMEVVFQFTQDATGGRTLSYGSAYKFPGGVAPTLSSTANAVDILSGIVDPTGTRVHLTGILKDFK